MAFSSLSESGFIPTFDRYNFGIGQKVRVLISFREWLHSYDMLYVLVGFLNKLKFSSLSESGFIPTIFLIILLTGS